MQYLIDVFNRYVCLTDERLQHINSIYPEMMGQIDMIQKTLENHDIVVQSRSSHDVVLFYHIAEQKGQSVRKLIEQILLDYLHHEKQRIMQQEIQAYATMHANLWVNYPDEHVAIHQGKMIDNDHQVSWNNQHGKIGMWSTCGLINIIFKLSKCSKP